ncbi:2-amino-4-hydroxy-6-hydroxymethyldihydropteridine diphosphokinase [Oscillatoria sp. HE19RPO]|uniref:2-amino-4-hydroxy-6- hydroxymethyldihydropteridine diphosphokinase n=1 Tax=Oscillatoria sp. HE19RPO TaxID=2954806 RepID=UPI0020C20976|nr:2-amino-4-hydroxy-6-hydroxymethyldihydropteridine diphosphokinase [Oscillatoria sp. HE19RPO]
MLTSTMTAIGLGSNLGDSRSTLESALAILDRTPGIELKKRSIWYKTAPIGPSQPDYFNGCALLEVQLNPQELLKVLLNIERQFGRIRQERWGPRTLDLDILLFGDLILETSELQLPHPRMRERAFVLVPLAEIVPNWIDPVSGEAIAQLLEKVDRSGVSLPLKLS